MSVELYLVCHNCGSGLWAGCDGFSGPQFLSANQAEMKALGDYLYNHMGHRLEYGPDHKWEDEYELRHMDGQP